MVKVENRPWNMVAWNALVFDNFAWYINITLTKTNLWLYLQRRTFISLVKPCVFEKITDRFSKALYLFFWNYLDVFLEETDDYWSRFV